MSKLYCTECGVENPENSKFCTNCGTRIGTSTTASPTDIKPPENCPTFVPPVQVFPPVPSMSLGKRAPTDKTLTMLAEYCRKTCATIGGDGYTEWVLNRCADGSLQIDYYRNYVGYTDEVHETYPAPDDTWDRILAVREKYDLKTPPADRSMGMCGGITLIKICDGDNSVRIVDGRLTENERKGFSEVMNILVGNAGDK